MIDFPLSSGFWWFYYDDCLMSLTQAIQSRCKGFQPEKNGFFKSKKIKCEKYPWMRSPIVKVRTLKNCFSIVTIGARFRQLLVEAKSLISVQLGNVKDNWLVFSPRWTRHRNCFVNQLVACHLIVLNLLAKLDFSTASRANFGRIRSGTTTSRTTCWSCVPSDVPTCWSVTENKIGVQGWL